MNSDRLLMHHVVLRSFIENVAASGVSGVSQIIIFGSVAKNTATEASDIDILVLLKSYDPMIKEKIHHAAYKAMEDDNFKRLLSLHFMEERRFGELVKAGYSFESSIEAEGVPLWKAA